MHKIPVSHNDASDRRRAYEAPSVSSYRADDLRAFLGVAYAMSSAGDGGGGIDTYPRVSASSRSGAKFGRH